MVKRLQIIFTFAIFGVIYMAQSNNSGPGWAYTSAPGESNCQSCHSGSAVQTSGYRHSKIKLQHTMSGGGYKPDSVYTLILTFKDTLRTKAGFQITALNPSNSPAGTFATLDARTQAGSSTVSSQTRSFLGHTSTGATNISTDSTSWKIKWTAPSSNVGKVTFYVNVNSVNSNGTTSGDLVFAKTFEINPSSQLPTAKINSPTNNCMRSNINFSATVTNSPTIYKWIFGGGVPATSSASSPTVQFATSGAKTAYLEVTNSSGKSRMDTFKFTVLANATKPVITSKNGKFTKCIDESLVLYTSKISAVSNIWLPDSIKTDTFTASNAKIYKVRAILNSTGCSIESDPVTISNYAKQSFSLTRINGDTICQGDSAKFSLKGNPKITSSYVMEGNTTLATGSGSKLSYILPLSGTGLHTLKVYATDSNGCKMDSNVITYFIKAAVAGPVMIATNKTYNSLKFNWNALSGASAYEVSYGNGPWTPTLNGGTDKFFLLSGLPNNTVQTIKVRGIMNGHCLKSLISTKSDSVLSCPNVDFALEYDTMYCKGSKMIFKVLNPTLSNYIIFINSDSFANATTIDYGIKSGQGVFSAYMTDASKSCYSKTQQVPFKYDSLSSIGKLASKNYEVCKNTSSTDNVVFSLNNASAAKYNWYKNGIFSNSTTSPFITLNVKNGDKIHATQTKGACKANSDSATVTFTGELDCKFAINRNYPSSKYTLKANKKNGVHQWKVGDSIISQNTDSFVQDFAQYRGVKKYIKHSIYISSNCNCTDSTLIDFDQLGVKPLGKMDFTVSPNPSLGNFTITMQNALDAIYMLYDMQGKIISKGKINNGSALINSEEMPAGVYLLQVSNEKATGSMQVTLVK